MAAFDKMLVPLLNHLIQGESWARERLRPYAGAQTLIRTGLLDIHLIVDAHGLFLAGSAEQPVAVTVSLPADTPLRFLIDRKSVFQAAKLAGSADFAETLAFVFRNLRWDAEADLAAWVGDIPARRLEMLRQSLLVQAQDAAGRLFHNLAEYASEDSDWLAPRRDIGVFCSDVDRLRDDLARLEKRLNLL